MIQVCDNILIFWNKILYRQMAIEVFIATCVGFECDISQHT